MTGLGLIVFNLIGLAIFFGGYFARVYESPYFPMFVLLLMGFGMVNTILVVRYFRRRTNSS